MSDPWLPFQEIEAIHIEIFSVALKSDHDREADRRFGRRNCKDEKHQNLAIQDAPCAGKRNERKIDRVQHQLHAHQHCNHVATNEDSDRSKDKQNRRNKKRHSDELAMRGTKRLHERAVEGVHYFFALS